MKKKIALVFVILALILAGCASKSFGVVSTQAPAVGLRQSNDVTGAPAQEALPGLPAPADMTKSTAGGSGVGGGPDAYAPLHNRMVITTTDLTIVVKDPQKKMETVSQLAAQLGGWVVSSNIYQAYTQNGDSAPQGAISIRVPSDKLDETLSEIKADALEVRSETRSGQDVTSQFTDLQSQLTNLEQAEKDLQAIMDEAKDNPNSNTASKTQDVLSVYSQITQVRGQIEQIKGQMQYYQQSSDTSLINLTLIAEETVKPIEIGGWKPQGVARDAIQALVKFLQGFVNFVIYLVLLVLPVLIVIFGPIALIVWGIVALVRRRKARKARGA
jgi:hypothetical protein